jgi:hypothetical protein
LPLRMIDEAQATFSIWNPPDDHEDNTVAYVGISTGGERLLAEVDYTAKTLETREAGLEDLTHWPVRSSLSELPSASWTASLPDGVDVLERSPSGQLVAARHHPSGDGSAAWVFIDTKTGERLWSTEVSDRVVLAWDADHYVDDDGLAHEDALLIGEHAFELVKPRTRESVDIMYGLGPAWRWVSDEQAPTRFGAEHVNAEGLTMRPHARPR